MRRHILRLALLAALVAMLVPDLRAGAPNPQRVLDSENLLEKLRHPLAALSEDVRAGSLPAVAGRGWLLNEVRTVDLANAPLAGGTNVVDIGAVRRVWPAAAEERVLPYRTLSLWRPFLDQVESFDHAGFYNIRGDFVDDGYRTKTGFKALARLKSGKLAHIAATIRISWTQTKHGWRVAEFATRELRMLETDRVLFEDVLDQSVSGAAYKSLTHSARDDLLVDFVTSVSSGDTTFEKLTPGIVKAHVDGTNTIAMGQVSVVDIDRDGHDDFYVTASTETAMFFRSKGDGTFEEISKDLGLDLAGVYAVVFADFDNDGDKDAFISYLVKGTRYLAQEDGRFVDRSDRIAGDAPSWVVAMSVIDYDNDGLLDVFFGAWAGQFIGPIGAEKERQQAAGKLDYSFPGLPEREGRELVTRIMRDDADPVLSRPGPPNVLLKNQGDGRFARPAVAKMLAGYYNTLATTWSDYDRDGDLDLYVTNEAGPNEFYRNEGDGTFKDIADDVTGEYGYGMGATWGDYDNDGKPDLYVTNMYSKAGIRIAEQLRASDGVKASARGNSLIRNRGGSFKRVENTPVEAADFGWGGAFADFNNDGRLDIYAPAGYVTIPEEVATIGDT